MNAFSSTLNNQDKTSISESQFTHLKWQKQWPVNTQVEKNIQNNVEEKIEDDDFMNDIGDTMGDFEIETFNSTFIIYFSYLN